MTSLTIVNATPHLIRVSGIEPADIPPSGVVLRLRERRRVIGSVMGFTLIEKEYTGLEGEDFLKVTRPTMVIVSTIVGIWIKEHGLKWPGVLVVAPDTGATAKRKNGFLVGVNSLTVYSNGLEDQDG